MTQPEDHTRPTRKKRSRQRDRSKQSTPPENHGRKDFSDRAESRIQAKREPYFTDWDKENSR